ncbi:hypothetical protein D9M68_605120 [compost metagenome]
MPTSRAPTRFTAVARSALPATVRSNTRKNSPLSTTAAPTISTTWPLTVKPSPSVNTALVSGVVREPSGPKNSRPRPESRKCNASDTISSTSTEASAIGWNTTRASSGARGTTSSTATAMCTATGTPGRAASQASTHGMAGSTPHISTAFGMRAASPRRSRLPISVASASAASTATMPMVGGTRPVSKAASDRAAKAAMSPNGTNTTRVTEKISTSPSPASR